MNDLLILEDLTNLAGQAPQTLADFARNNPLVHAAILERASIDGDVPEFRGPSDPLPVEGFRPAIPVVTDSINPVHVGIMLERASLEIRDRFKIAHHDFYSMTLGGQDLALPVSVVGYVAGEIPDLMIVPDPHAMVLAGCPADKIRYFIWLSLATTQGRRSLAPAIERELERRVGSLAGIVGDPISDLDARWLVTVYGPDDLSNEFNPVESAVAFFTETLRMQFLAHGPLAYTVKPLADIAGRRFGWLLRMGQLEGRR